MNTQLTVYNHHILIPRPLSSPQFIHFFFFFSSRLKYFCLSPTKLLSSIMTSFNMLPEDCLTEILSLTTPLDTCRISATCSSLRSAALSDHVWGKFLPCDYQQILAQIPSSSDSSDSDSMAVTLTLPLFGSKKQLFFFLCNSVFIDGGNKIFKLERSSGLKSYILSAKALSITWVDLPLYWSWRSASDSRFKELAELRTTSWLEILGKINTQMLSPYTTYAAYLILKVSNRSYGLDTMPMETSVQVGNTPASTNSVLLTGPSDDDDGKKQQQILSLFYSNRTQMLESRVITSQGCDDQGRGSRGPCLREDGWLEIELGEFYVGDKEEQVKMRFMEIKGHHLKAGLVIEGIEIRPIVNVR